MNKVELGKIKSVDYRLGGRDDDTPCVEFELGGESWGVCATLWEHQFSELPAILREAKTRNLQGLIGTPVEVTFASSAPSAIITSWRILKEVL